MFNLLKRKFAVDEREVVQTVKKRPRTSPLEKADPAAAPPISMARRIGRHISSFVSGGFNIRSIRTPNFRRAGAGISRLFNTPIERQTKRYEMTPALPLGSEWRSARSYYVLGDKVPVTENKQYEFKTGGGNYPQTILPEHIRKYGSAFLNSDGGVLLAGVLDDGTIQGIVCKENKIQAIQKSVALEFSKFLPPVTPEQYQVSFIRVAQRWRRGVHDYLKDRYVLEVVVQPGNPGEIYEDQKHKVFIKREGSVEGPLSPLQIKDIVINKYRQIVNKRRLEKREELNQEVVDTTARQAQQQVIWISP